MKIEHAEPQAFHKLLHGEASREETRAIVRHLLAGCGRCIQRSSAAQRTVETPPEPGSYDLVFDRLQSFFDETGAREERPAARMAYAGLRR
jgi:hypothetical protein